MRAVLDQFRNGFLAVRRARPPQDDGADDMSTRTTRLIFASGRRTPAQVAAVRASLSETVAAYFDGDDSDAADAVRMSLLIGDFLEPGNEAG